VHLHRSGERLVVMADTVRLEQVVMNLLLNAAKFTPDGGTISVAVARDGALGLVSVTDTGMGIDPDKLDVIFELFAQEPVSLARSNGGLGIGLTLVKRLAHMHGGTVRARSDGKGRGSSFEVRMPLAAPSPDARARAAPAKTVAQRVLIVEDGKDTRDSLGMLIEAWGHHVVYATNGPEGVERAGEERPDVILVDIGLPGYDGYQVARTIRAGDDAWRRTVRLIALTGYGQPADRARAMDSGFDAHVLKPVEPGTLQEMLRA
jgi:CheY-like chemotaxis protein